METAGESSTRDAHPDRIRILHVDADPEVAARTVDSLEREDDRFDGIAVTTAREGLDVLDTTRIDCIVSGFDLPETDGLAFLDAVREREPSLPFLLFVGSDGVASDAISAGATDCLRRDGGADRYPILANRIGDAVERDRLRRHRDRQRAILETARERVAILDTDGRIVDVNRAYAEPFGYEPADLVGDPWDRLFPDDEAAFVRSAILPAAFEDGEWRGETTGIRADGETIVVDHRLSRTEAGELVCTAGEITDRTDRDRDLERYETIVEGLGDPVYTVDAEGCYAFVNDAYADMTGYARDEIVGQPVSFLLDAPSTERGEDVVRTLLSDDTETTQETYEITVETKDGDRIRCEDNLSLLPLEDGQYRGVAGVVRDVTERTERKRELERYETILRTIPDEVYTLDADGHFTSVIPPNDAELTTTGYDPDELIGEHVSILMDEDDISTGEARIQELLERDDHEKASFEMDLITVDGERIPNENHVALLPSDDGSFRGTVGVLRDISARKERERELRRKNERLESFASIVSHDLRNPLNVAQGELELARQTRDSDRLEAVAGALDRMQRLIDDILTVTRAGESEPETEPIDLESFADVCWRTVETGVATLRTESGVVVRADRSEFKRLLENLIRNAVEHSSTSPASNTQQDAVEHGSTSPDSQVRQDAVEHGSTDGSPRSDDADGERDPLTVSIGLLPDGTGFYVEDDGPGIPSGERDHVFESGYSTTADGTGFGLAIAARVADAHGWTVDVTDGEDGGARFEFRGVEMDT